MKLQLFILCVLLASAFTLPVPDEEVSHPKQVIESEVKSEIVNEENKVEEPKVESRSVPQVVTENEKEVVPPAAVVEGEKIQVVESVKADAPEVKNIKDEIKELKKTAEEIKETLKLDETRKEEIKEEKKPLAESLPVEEKKRE